MDSNRVVDEIMEPEDFELMAYLYALESYNDFERYGFPYEGASMDQPYIWKLAVSTVKDALDAARAEARAAARAAVE